MAKQLSSSFDKDKDGVRYQHPERTCKECAKYPCFRGQEELVIMPNTVVGNTKIRKINYKFLSL